jgi:hypothetical protein
MKHLLTEWRQFLKEGDIESAISKTLTDEGGAAGFDPLHKAAKKIDKDISKKDVEDILKKMDNVTKHRDGDYIKEGSGKRRVPMMDQDNIDTQEDPWEPEEDPIDEQYYHIQDATYEDGTLAEDLEFWDDIIEEAEYQGRKVKLNKPMRGDVKKSKVYVKDPKTGNVKKVNFGDKNMKIKKSNPKRRKSFRARHNCKNPGPKTKARYWSCKAW